MPFNPMQRPEPKQAQPQTQPRESRRKSPSFARTLRTIVFVCCLLLVVRAIAFPMLCMLALHLADSGFDFSRLLAPLAGIVIGGVPLLIYLVWKAFSKRHQ